MFDYKNEDLFYDKEGNWDPVEDLWGRTTNEPNFGDDRPDDEIKEECEVD